MNWYVVNSYSGQELSVQKLIEAFRDGSDAEGLAFKGRVGEVRVPTHDVTSMSGGRRRVTKSKNFPGYVLVEADMDQSLMNALATIPGVIQIYLYLDMIIRFLLGQKNNRLNTIIIVQT